MRSWLSRIVAALAAASLWAAPALAAVPALDGSAATHSGSAVSSDTVTLTTGGATCTGNACVVLLGVNLICAAGTCSGGPYTVSSVSGCSLTWHQRTSKAGSETGVDGTNNVDIEEWYAQYSSTISSCTITVSFSGASYDAIGAQGISGICSSSPFDAHAPLTNLAANVSAVATVGTQVTSNTNDLLFEFIGAEYPGSYSSSSLAGHAGSSLMTATNSAGALYSYFGSAYVTETTAQSGTTSFTTSNGSTYTSAMIADAVSNSCASTPTLKHLLLLLGVGQ